MHREPGEIYFGLSERVDDMNRAHQCCRMRDIGTIGYSVRTTDPLYKYIPLYVTWQSENRTGFGLFCDALSDRSFDMGHELNNHHGHYRYFVAPRGSLDCYFITSPDTPFDATRRFMWMTDHPA